MLRVLGRRYQACDGVPRRDFLRLGMLGSLAASLPAAAFGEPGKEASFGRAKRCILLFLTGGPSQHDTFDCKPDAPAEIRGELKPIATNVAGIQVSELFPKLAQQADKFCIVRSVTHRDPAHTSAGYSMLTGLVHPKAGKEGDGMALPAPEDHPHVGSLLALHRQGRGGPPPFVSLPEVIKDAAVNEFPGQGGGFLGKSYDPLRIEASQERTAFEPPALVLPADVTGQRLADRSLLRGQLNELVCGTEAMRNLDGHYERALGLFASSSLGDAFALDREPQKVRNDYGTHLFGQGCLLARRLIEAGVELVTVYWHYEGPEDSPVWDTHGNNYPHLRQRLAPPTDQAASALLADLHQRGLLDETLVIVMGEFGRTPRVNASGGRDHWPHVQSILLAGAGIPGGTVYGASDKQGAYPAEKPIAPADLIATTLHLMGVPRDMELVDRTGRPLRACSGEPVWGLLG
ncbi:MAG TPA: DUF1501 domain-containing protein [Pirellulaceae bacterium]|nr:DUF1501 domain-containing protein [Pirellulaceae bacterium]